MSVCIMWGMVLATFFKKKYTKKLSGSQSAEGGKKSGIAGFGDIAMTAMFIGLVSAYIGSYIGDFISTENGLFSFSGAWTPLAVVAVSALVMAGFLLAQREKEDGLGRELLHRGQYARGNGRGHLPRRTEGGDDMEDRIRLTLKDT